MEIRTRTLHINTINNNSIEQISMNIIIKIIKKIMTEVQKIRALGLAYAASDAKLRAELAAAVAAGVAKDEDIAAKIADAVVAEKAYQELKAQAEADAAAEVQEDATAATEKAEVNTALDEEIAKVSPAVAEAQVNIATPA